MDNPETLEIQTKKSTTHYVQDNTMRKQTQIT